MVGLVIFKILQDMAQYIFRDFFSRINGTIGLPLVYMVEKRIGNKRFRAFQTDGDAAVVSNRQL